ncbi:acriflavin resistance protein [Bacteroides pyogenes JCM 10003]|nr:acriflavin resistance protein [Bacteroides pyogenes JCM 10003]
MEQGISGKIAKAFITSKLSILLMVAFLMLGAFSIYFIPREEEPQIEVPMADIMIGYPGATPQEVESSVCNRLKKSFRISKGWKTYIPLR